MLHEEKPVGSTYMVSTQGAHKENSVITKSAMTRAYLMIVDYLDAVASYIDLIMCKFNKPKLYNAGHKAI
jgi:hypothetical protein